MGPGEGEQVVTVSEFTARTRPRQTVRVRVRRPAAVSELRTATCPSSCPRPSRTRREDRRSSCPTSRPLLSGLVQASDPAGRSPGYCRSTRCSSSAESPRPSRRCASSSAPPRNAARSCRLRWRRCSAAPTEGSGCGFTVMDSLAPTTHRCALDRAADLQHKVARIARRLVLCRTAGRLPVAAIEVHRP